MNRYEVLEFPYTVIANERGEIRYKDGKYTLEMNLSSEISKLIKVAGETCDHYASDLFISIRAMMNHIENLPEPGIQKLYLFGFRDMGVDHDNFIFSRAEDCWKPFMLKKTYPGGIYGMFFNDFATTSWGTREVTMMFYKVEIPEKKFFAPEIKETVTESDLWEAYEIYRKETIEQAGYSCLMKYEDWLEFAQYDYYGKLEEIPEA